MHSNAALDLYFLAKLSSETAEFPEMKDEIESECARCHMPMASTQALAEGEIYTITGDTKYEDFALEGVSCTLCHQIRNEDLGEDSSFSGHYDIDFKSVKPDRGIFGPFYPSHAKVMVKNSGYYPVRSENFRKAELCAICHTLYTPVIENGKVKGYFPEQTPYLEWLNSDYSPGVICQSCHMKGGRAKVTAIPPNAPVRDMKAHHFSGANVQLLKIHGDLKGAERAENQIKSAAKVKIESVILENGQIRVKVKVENFAGHKFPTGFPSRRAFLHFTVKDTNGLIFESGKYYENGKIDGEDEPYEPHYDVIDSEDKVQIYESVMVDTRGKVTSVLLSASEYIKDNRIPPSGFDKQSAHPDTAIKGEAVFDDNFEDGSDEITYIVKGSYSTPIEVRVELLYQPVSYRFLKSLHPSDLTEKFLRNFENVNKTTLVSFDEKVVTN